jgi:hypothetical protein
MEAIKESEGRSKGGKVLDKWIADLAVRWPCRILLHYAGSRSLKFSMHTWLRRNAVAPDVSEFGCREVGYNMEVPFCNWALVHFS